MKASNKKLEAYLRNSLTGFCKLQFVLITLIIGQTIIYDASKLITPEVVLDRWFVIAGLLVVNGLIWYLVKSRAGHAALYKSLLGLMVLSDILLASYFVYEGRGMASKAVILFVIPIVIAGALKSKSALFATAIFSISAYTLAAVSYFVINFNEGYKVELYGEIGFYSVILLLVAGLLAKLLKSRD